MQYADITDKNISVDNASIFKTLDDLYQSSRQTLLNKNVTLEDTRQLAGYVTQVRVLLAELEHIETRLQRSETALSYISGLKQRYLELEGMVKEARNTLHRNSAAPLTAF